MKKFLILLAVVLGLLGCASTINRVQDKWGPPARIEQAGDLTIYYYYFNKGKGSGVGIPIGRTGAQINLQESVSGLLCVELTCDKDGNIVKKRQYWVQPNFTK